MKKPKINYEPDELWKPFYKGDWDEAVLVSGRGFGKSWHGANFITLNTLKNFSYRTLLARDVGSSISQSILETVKARFISVDEQTKGLVKHFFEIQESQIKKRKLNESQRELVNIITKGFRTSRVEQQADLKGFEDMDLAVLEEAQDIRDENRVRTLFDTLKKPGNKKIIMLNTPDLEHWVIKRYFDYVPTEYKGYFKLIPKKLDRVCIIIGDYTDNPHLDETTAQTYTSYGKPEHYKYDLDYYLSDILGYAREKQNLARKFDLDKVKRIEIREPIRYWGQIGQFNEVIPGKIYSIGVDVSSGEAEDYSGLTCREFSPNYPLAFQFKGKVSPERLAVMLSGLIVLIKSKGGIVYVAPEANNHGGILISNLRRLQPGIEDFMYRRQTGKPELATFDPKLTTQYGFWTGNHNRNGIDGIISEWGILFDGGGIEVCSKEEVQEMENFVWSTKENRYTHAEGHHDDVLISDFICVANFRFIAKFG